MGRPISFRDRIAPHLSAVAYTPGDWTAANCREGVAFTSFSIRITVVMWLLLVDPFCPTGNWAKLPQKLHCVAKIAHSVNKVKIAWRKDHNFLGRLAISFSFNLAIHCTSKNVVPSRNFNFSRIQASIQLYVYMWIFCIIVCDFPAVS